MTESAMLHSQASEPSEQRTTLEQSSAPNTDLQSKLAAQDNASQGDVLSDNLQASSEVVQFEVFGQTQEAINGESDDPWPPRLSSQVSEEQSCALGGLIWCPATFGGHSWSCAPPLGRWPSPWPYKQIWHTIYDMTDCNSCMSAFQGRYTSQQEHGLSI